MCSRSAAARSGPRSCSDSPRQHDSGRSWGQQTPQSILIVVVLPATIGGPSRPKISPVAKSTLKRQLPQTALECSRKRRLQVCGRQCGEGIGAVGGARPGAGGSSKLAASPPGGRWRHHDHILKCWAAAAQLLQANPPAKQLSQTWASPAAGIVPSRSSPACQSPARNDAHRAAAVRPPPAQPPQAPAGSGRSSRFSSSGRPSSRGAPAATRRCGASARLTRSGVANHDRDPSSARW